MTVFIGTAGIRYEKFCVGTFGFLVIKLVINFNVVVFLIRRGNRDWRKLHNEEFNDLYFSPNIVPVIKSRRTSWAEYVAHMVEGRGLYNFLVWKPDGKRPLRIPRHR
jgi:hypothetical protein